MSIHRYPIFNRETTPGSALSDSKLRPMLVMGTESPRVAETSDHAAMIEERTCKVVLKEPSNITGRLLTIKINETNVNPVILPPNHMTSPYA